MSPKHASVGGYEWKSTTCLKCHADSQVAPVAAHTVFAIDSSSKHWQASCLTCHAAARTDKPFGQDFAKNDCTTCHAEAKDQTTSRHSYITGFAPDSPSCVACHPKGGQAAFNHAPFFPIDAASKHASVTTCAQCHPDPKDRARSECTICHTQTVMASKHTQVGGYAWQTTTAATRPYQISKARSPGRAQDQRT
jgi:uncharacterized paraquat-inducible protein A